MRQNNFLFVGGAQKNIFFSFLIQQIEEMESANSPDTVRVKLNELILHLCQAVFVLRFLIMVFMPKMLSYEQR